MYNIISKKNSYFILDFKKILVTTIFSYWNGNIMIAKNTFHEEHNDTYCDLPSTFLLDDEFAFKSPS